LPTSSAAEIREWAETPDRFSLIPPGGSVERHDDGEVCVLQGPLWAAISGVRTADVDAVVERVRALVPADKEQVWWLGPSVEPADLHEQLVSRGFVEPDDRAHTLHAVALVDAPPAPPDGVEVRRVETWEDYLASREVQWEGFAVSPERREKQRQGFERDYEESVVGGALLGFLAFADGRPAATALAVPSSRGLFLIAGSTAPWARGRGLYRALVWARWQAAVQRGTPALVTEAVPETSYPILKRLGFQDICLMRRLADPR
jgi:hypothetical protein